MSKFTEGLASGVGEAVIGLGSSVLGGLASSIFGNDDLENQERLMNLQFSNNAALMRLQADLNSPETIAKEYQKAGFNPYVVMGQGAGSSGGQASGSSVSIPEAAYSTVPSTIGLLTADTLQKLAGAYKSAKEGSVVRNVAESSIFKNYAEGLSAKARATLDNIEADFKKTYGDKLYQGEISKKAAEVAELYQKANLAIAQQDYTEAQMAIVHLEQVIKNEIAKQEDYKSQMLAQRLNSYPQMLRLEIQGLEEKNRETHARGTEAYASATEHRSKAGLADAQKEFQDFDNSLRRDFKKEIYENYLKKLVAEGELNDKDASAARLEFERIERMRDAVNYTEFNKSLDAALELVKEKLSIFK